MPEFPGTHPLKKRLPAAEAEKIIASWRGKTDVPEADFGNIKTEKEKSDGIASSVDDSSSVASAARHPIYPMNPLLAEDFFRDVYADLFKCSVVCD